MNELKPIKTRYRGIEFRSKLEAQWAVFFDQCGIEWEYEPQGYDLGEGLFYLPDFLVHNVPLGFVDEDAHFRWVMSDQNEEDPTGDLFKRDTIKNLWIEVKGNMDEQSAAKINKFSSLLNKDSEIIVVGSLPFESFWDNAAEQLEYKSKFDCYFHELGARWTGFPVILGIDETRTMGIYGSYKWFSRVGLQSEATSRAYDFARNYRFDHRHNN